MKFKVQVQNLNSKFKIDVRNLNSEFRSKIQIPHFYLKFKYFHLTRTICENILSMIENQKKIKTLIQNSSSKLKFKT